MKNYARQRVDHGGKGGDRQDIPGNFYSALFGGALDFVEAFRMRHRTDMPDVVENIARVVDEDGRELAIVGPGAGNGGFVNLAGSFVEEKRYRRDVSLSAVQLDIALALLLGVVKRVCVEKRPDELAANVFEAKFEVGVLINGVMTAVESGRADV